MNVAVPTYISLFAGCGGLDLGISIAVPNARCVLYVEREIGAARILAARMEDGSLDPAPIWSDVCTVDGFQLRGRVDGIIGGFPCTDLSVAGRQEGITGEHSGLWFEYLQIIREVRPRWAFIENVPAVIAHPAGGIVLGGLAESGFDAEWLSLRASDVGAPHRRERVFILAHAPLRVLGVRGEPSGGSGLADGRDGVVAHPTRHERPGPHGQDRRGRGVCETGDGMADPGDGLLPQPRRGSQGRDGVGSAGADGLPLFPPGPSDSAAWRDVLGRWPWLAPALESGVRGDVDGVAVVVDQSRADSLRAIGNGVVAVQGAAAFIELSRRAGIDWGGGQMSNQWVTPRTITGGAESAERKQELGRTASGGGDLQAQVCGWDGTL